MNWMEWIGSLTLPITEDEYRTLNFFKEHIEVMQNLEPTINYKYYLNEINKLLYEPIN